MNPSNVTDEVILKDAITKLSKLLEEEKVAAIEKDRRDASIQKARVVIELYSNGKSFEDLSSNHENALEKTNILQVIKPDISPFIYPLAKTWAVKIIAIIKNENRVLSVNEIIEVVEQHEKNYTTKQLLGLISNTINTNLVKKGDLKIYKPLIKIKGFYYGNPSWWDGEELRKEYYPKPKDKKLW
jgi:hypothetical protein